MKKSDINSFELPKQVKSSLAMLGNFFQACSTHGGKSVLMNGVIPEKVYLGNMASSQK